MGKVTFVEKKDCASMVPAVCAWYHEHRRDLPWRNTRDPYRIWVSEIMLQQTRVEAVKPYYERFLAALPDVESLAACPEDRLLKLWEGLGYYSRVRNMQRAAQLILENARFPKTEEALRKLPGIGPYTAGAIASLAYDVPVPAVDGNAFRILTRVRADEREIDNERVKRELTAELAAEMQEFFFEKSGTALGGCSRKSGENREYLPGDFNQGLMDLGATICLPNAEPRCGLCPLSGICMAHAAGRETAFPVRAKKKPRRVEEKIVLIIRDGGRVALVRRPAKGLLAGMYEFPNLPVKKAKISHEESGRRGRTSGRLRKTEEQRFAEITGFVQESGLVPLQVSDLGEAKHIFSHVEWHMRGYEVRVAALDAADETTAPGAAEKQSGGSHTWILADIADIERNYPIPSAYAAYAAHLQLRHGAAAARGQSEETGAQSSQREL